MRIPKIETLVIVIIFFAVGLWAFQRCSSKRSDLARRVQDFNERNVDEEQEERPVRRDTARVSAQPAANPALSPQVSSGAAEAAPAATPSTVAPANRSLARPTLANPTPPQPAASTAAKGSVLFVVIDGLKVRQEPGLKGDPVAKLALHETVTFLNQKTEWTQELNLGDQKVTDHWVKIRTKSGKEGWVFGAGVHYYKK
jgi:hypothetical protein